MLTNNDKVVFEPMSHTYLNHDWVELMGVTTLMKKHGLSPSYDGIDYGVLQRAAARGSHIHKQIEDYCQMNQMCGDITPECQNFIKLNLDVIGNEYLVSDNQMVATMIDVVLADYCLCDIKTTNTFHHEAVSWQLSICAYLFEIQNPSIKAGDLYGIHLRGKIAKLIKVERKDNATIERLFECERNGEPFESSELIVTPADDLAKLLEIEKFIAHIETQAKAAKENRDKMAEKIYASMEAQGQKKIQTDAMTITRVMPSARVSVDGKKLQSDYPDAYAACLKESLIKGSIRITIK